MIENMKIMKIMMRGKEAECPDDTSPVDMEEGVNDIKDDKNEKNYWVKDAECYDESYPIEMEEDVKYLNDDKNEIYD